MRPIAAILADSGPMDLLSSFARQLTAQGVRVRGLIQQHDPDMQLVDVHSGQTYAITQNLGPDSEACRIDPSGFAEASVVLRAALAEPADLVIVNRFGKLEAGGAGLSAEMLAVMAEGVPLLTTLHAELLEQWQHFTGHAGVLLPADLEALHRWWDGVRQG
ncbi:conserved protein of unknown function [Magnetospirillum gryphiswaldense MSR-1 v2]|uniref:DUF2478 domain-containing protein n=1 Tax=Magnetospirillum gryphiswaldense (strain DSM 6361 / JCM 21280 / NBRC 15271 / MSR-1) TaxID=431944 RepID=V6EZ84_MAGGM|nr:DUF2478 domain-containing protein [Magnetospirillum gryphiswaldense]CDK98570.1 conserved protein of unknown function [Magnetospirillum gryphiswaldense MSR-1 v2]